MSRTSQAQRIVTAAAFGGTGLAGLGTVGFAVLLAQAGLTRRAIGTPFGLEGPDASGFYPAPRRRASDPSGPAAPGGGEPADAPAAARRARPPLRLGLLGDSSSVGLGVQRPEQAPGAVLAEAVARLSGRDVDLLGVGRVGARSSSLPAQVQRLLEEFGAPDVAVILIGVNDVTHRVPPSESVRYLRDAVQELRAAGSEVVVGTCPDLGVLEPLRWPLRAVARRWSRSLAAAQTIVVVEAGGRSVSLGDLLGEDFARRRSEMFSQDRFHPSPAGYARVVEVMLPSVCDAAGVCTTQPQQRPDVRRGEGMHGIAHAAVRAAATPGTEVSAAQVDGAHYGPRGRWALLLRRRRPVAEPAPQPQEPAADDADSPAGERV